MDYLFDENQSKPVLKIQHKEDKVIQVKKEEIKVKTETNEPSELKRNNHQNNHKHKKFTNENNVVKKEFHNNRG